MSDSRRLQRDRARWDAQQAEELYVQELETENDRLQAQHKAAQQRLSALESRMNELQQTVECQVSQQHLAKRMRRLEQLLGLGDVDRPGSWDHGEDSVMEAGATSSGPVAPATWTEVEEDDRARFGVAVAEAVSRRWSLSCSSVGAASASSTRKRFSGDCAEPETDQYFPDCVVDSILSREPARKRIRHEVTEEVLPQYFRPVQSYVERGLLPAGVDNTATGGAVFVLPEALVSLFHGKEQSLRAFCAATVHEKISELDRSQRTRMQEVGQKIDSTIRSNVQTCESRLDAELQRVQADFATQLKQQGAALETRLEREEEVGKGFREDVVEDLNRVGAKWAAKLCGNGCEDEWKSVIGEERRAWRTRSAHNACGDMLASSSACAGPRRLLFGEKNDSAKKSDGKVKAYSFDEPEAEEWQASEFGAADAVFSSHPSSDRLAAPLSSASLSGSTRTLPRVPIESAELLATARTASNVSETEDAQHAFASLSQDRSPAASTVASKKREDGIASGAGDCDFERFSTPESSAAGETEAGADASTSARRDSEKGNQPHQEEGVIHQIAHRVFNRNFAQLKRTFLDAEYVRVQSDFVQSDFPRLQLQLRELDVSGVAHAAAETVLNEQWRASLLPELTRTFADLRALKVAEAGLGHAIEAAEQRQNLNLQINTADQCREVQRQLSSVTRNVEQKLQQAARLTKLQFGQVSAENGKIVEELGRLQLQVSGPGELSWTLPAITEKCIRSILSSTPRAGSSARTPRGGGGSSCRGEGVFALRHIDCELLLYPAGRLCSRPGYCAIVLKRVDQGVSTQCGEEKKSPPTWGAGLGGGGSVKFGDANRSSDTAADGGGSKPVSRNPFGDSAADVNASSSRSPISSAPGSGGKLSTGGGSVSLNGRMKVQFCFESRICCASDKWELFEGSEAVVVDNFLPGDRLREGLVVGVRVLS